MEKQKISTSRDLKFAIPSLLGAALFLIPMKVNGEFVLGVSILCDLIQGWMTPVVDALSLLFLGVAALLPFVAKIAKPGFILNNKTMRSLFDVSPLIIAVRVIAFVYVVCYLFQVGPEFIWNPATGGEAYYIVTTILTLMVGTSFLISLLTDFGIMDFVGILVRRLMRPLFTLPGRASLDCIASWVGSSLTGALLTSMQYKDGYYTKREACVIMTCFSTAAFSFIFILTRTCGLEAYFLPAVFAIYAAVIPCAILLPRVWPLSVQKDEYAMESPEIKEDIPEGLSKGQWALKCAVEKAETMTVKKFVLKGVQTIASVWFDVLPMVMFVATTGMIVNEYTPVFKFLTAPFVPVLNWMGFAEAEVAAPMLLTGFLDQFLPVAMANALTAVDTRFFIFCVAIAQIIYMSEIGVMMIRSKVDFNIGKIFIVFLERTILSMPIIWACTRLLIH